MSITAEGEQSQAGSGITFGDLPISAMYFGSSAVSKMYWGDILVYESGAEPTVYYDIGASITHGSVVGDMRIAQNGTATLTIIPDSGYALPFDGTVVVANASSVYDPATGVVTISDPTDDVTVTATCHQLYPITKNTTNLTLEGADEVADGGSVVLAVKPVMGACYPPAYQPPFTITGATGTYSSTNKTYTVSNPTGPVTISIAVEKLDDSFLYLKNETGSAVSEDLYFEMNRNSVSAVYYDGDLIYGEGSSATSPVAISIAPTSGSERHLLRFVGGLGLGCNSSRGYPNIFEANLGREMPLCYLSGLTTLELNYADVIGTYQGGVYHDLTALTSIVLGIKCERFAQRYGSEITNYLFINCNNAAISVDSHNTNYKTMNGALCTYDGTKVVWGAFIDSFTFPSSITSVDGAYAFTDSRITQIEFPSTVQEATGFKNSSLQSLICYSPAIGREGFSTSTLRAAILQPGVERIEYKAFYACTLLTELELPSSVKAIGTDIVPSTASSGLYTNGKITTDSAYNRYLKVGNNAYYAMFYVGSSASSFAPHSGCVLMNGAPFGESYGTYNTAIQSITSATIPSSVKRIPDYFFNGCTKLVSLTLNDGLECIGPYAFAGTSDSGFTSFTIPATVTEIEDGAFSNTTGSKPWTTFTFNENPSVTITFGSNVFKVKTARSMTVNHKGNSSVTSYNWSGDSITATFNVIS